MSCYQFINVLSFILASHLIPCIICATPVACITSRDCIRSAEYDIINFNVQLYINVYDIVLCTW